MLAAVYVREHYHSATLTPAKKPAESVHLRRLHITESGGTDRTGVDISNFEQCPLANISSAFIRYEGAQSKRSVRVEESQNPGSAPCLAALHCPQTH